MMEIFVIVVLLGKFGMTAVTSLANLLLKDKIHGRSTGLYLESYVY
jgi:hypothetical protein